MTDIPNKVNVRPLTHSEFLWLINNAEDSEVWAIKQLQNPYEFLTTNCIEHMGGVINGKPIYFGYLLNYGGSNIMWTVVAKDVKEQFSLYKLSKKVLMDWLRKHKEIYATMLTVNPINIKWAKHMGFEEIERSNEFVTLKIEEK